MEHDPNYLVRIVVPPCPQCGGEQSLRDYTMGSYAHVSCLECGVRSTPRIAIFNQSVQHKDGKTIEEVRTV